MRLTLISFAVFFLLCAAVVLLLRMDRGFAARRMERATRRGKLRTFQKQGRFRALTERLLTRCGELVRSSQMPPPAYYLLTALCAVGGYLAGRVIFSSFPIALSVATLGLIAPLLYFSFRETKAKAARLERLASSMTILSNSYIATEDLITSVQDDLEVLEYPEPFRDFLTYVTMMDSSVEHALRRMESQVDNPYFSQWIDALVLAQENRALKYAAAAVVDSMHDVLAVQAESDAAMYAVWRDYLMTLIMIFSVPLIFKFSLPDAYLTMTGSLVGQGLFVLLLAAVVFSVLCALKINRPLTL